MSWDSNACDEYRLFSLLQTLQNGTIKMKTSWLQTLKYVKVCLVWESNYCTWWYNDIVWTLNLDMMQWKTILWLDLFSLNGSYKRTPPIDKYWIFICYEWILPYTVLKCPLRIWWLHDRALGGAGLTPMLCECGHCNKLKRRSPGDHFSKMWLIDKE